MQMTRRGNGRLSRRLALVGMALYAVFLVASPFEHHDLSCELKTPQHCTSCASSQLGSDVLTLVVPGTSHLHDAGSAIALDQTFEAPLLVVRTTGRSPPHAG